jgi:hypothetical protein
MFTGHADKTTVLPSERLPGPGARVPAAHSVPGELAGPHLEPHVLLLERRHLSVRLSRRLAHQHAHVLRGL